MRKCDCDHFWPICACDEGHAPGSEALRARSEWLSELAGWPGEVHLPANWEQLRKLPIGSAIPSVPPGAKVTVVPPIKGVDDAGQVEASPGAAAEAPDDEG